MRSRARHWLFPILVALFGFAGAQAATIARIADIDPQVTFTTPAPTAYKTGWVLSAQNRPYFSDGSPANTRALATDHVASGPFVPFNGYVYYLGRFLQPPNSSTSYYASTLFKTDGTRAGTVSVFGNPQARSVDQFAVLGNAMYLFSSGTMYRSDGTAAGTVAVTSASPGYNEVYVVNGRILFSGSTSSGSGLVATDGTAAGTSVISPVSSYTMTVVGNKAYFWGPGPQLWVTDGTAAGTFALPTPTPAFGDVGSIAGANGIAYTFVRTDTNHAQLVRSDGTSAGTYAYGPIIEIARPYNLYSDGTRVYFYATPGNVTYELWQSDGTDTGTFKSTLPTPYDTGRGIATLGGTVYVLVSSSANGWQLYRDDNGAWTLFSTATVMPVAALGSQLLYPPGSIGAQGETPRIFTAAADEPDEMSSCGRNMAVVGSRWVFLAKSVSDGTCAMYSTDGTASGTSLLMAPPGGMTFDSNLTYPLVISTGSVAYFSIRTSTQAPAGQLYVTDGTVQGTVPVQAPDGSGATVQWSSVGTWNGQFVFADASNRVMAASGASATMLATAGGPVKATQSLGNALLWFEQRSDNTIGVMRYDGAVTEVSVVSVPPGAYVSYQAAVVSGSRLFYWFTTTSSPQLPADLYVTDGTPGGTTIVRSFAYIYYDGALALRNGLLFTAYESTTNPIQQMYYTDGTGAGTSALSGHSVAFRGASDGNHAWFIESYSYDYYHSALWRTDGTNAGTVKISELTTSDGWPTLTLYKGSLFFVGNGSSGRELWISNGSSAAGTRTLVDYSPGAASSLFHNYRWEPFFFVNDAFTLFMAKQGDGLEPHIVQLDTFPDGIAFNEVFNATPGATEISSPVLVTGAEVALPATASNGQVCVSSTANCACDLAPFSTQVLVNQQQYLCARHTASSTPGGSTTTDVSFGSSLAHFTSHTSGTATTVTLSVIRGGTGHGRIVSSPAGIDCTSACNASFPSGTSVTLTATPATGDRFVGWSGACSGMSSCTVVLSSSTSVTATFATVVSQRIAMRDLNGDGMADLLWRHSSGAQGAWLMNGDNASSGGVIPPPAAGATIRLSADFDGDGETDLLWRAPDGAYYVTLMNGLAVRSAAKLLDGGSGWEVSDKADFNGDGRSDLVWRHSSGAYGAWLMNGTTPLDGGVISPPAPGAVATLFADFDGDGRTDITWITSDGRMDVTLMSGLSYTSTAMLLGPGSGWRPTLAADLDGDGKADLVFEHTDGSHAAWLMDGIAIKGVGLLLGAGTGWTARFAADLDGDGMADLLWSHTDGSWGAWLMSGISARDGKLLVGAHSGWSMVAAADFSGDGKADLLWRDGSGQYAIWTMDGLGIIDGRVVLPAGTGWEALP